MAHNGPYQTFLALPSKIKDIRKVDTYRSEVKEVRFRIGGRRHLYWTMDPYRLVD
jgi:hypothetical protein